MVALGLALVLLSGVATLGVVLSNRGPVDASAFGISLSHVSVGGFFLAGAVAGLIFGLGLAMMMAGGARKRHKRVESKRAVRGVRSEKDELAAENDRLRSELAGQGSAQGSAQPYGAAEQPAPQERHGLFRR